MELQTVGAVSKEYNVSTRMLSYYEQNKLINSMKKEGYHYRLYDEANLKRLQQVLILRKLQIPVKQIGVILNNPDAATAIEIFKKNIRELDGEITALSTIRKILENFVNELESVANISLNLNFLNAYAVLETVGSLSLIQKNIKEKITMNELNQAAEILDKRFNMKVRVELAYNGNCREAIALYEKAFGAKAEGYGGESPVEHVFLRFEENPLVVHGEIGMHDRPKDNPCSYGDGVSVSVGFENAEAIEAVFDVLKDGGEIIFAPAKTYFMDCYCEVKDKFGVKWILMY